MLNMIVISEKKWEIKCQSIVHKVSKRSAGHKAYINGSQLHPLHQVALSSQLPIGMNFNLHTSAALFLYQFFKFFAILVHMIFFAGRC